MASWRLWAGVVMFTCRAVWPAKEEFYICSLKYFYSHFFLWDHSVWGGGCRNKLKFTQVLGILFAELAPIVCLFAVFGHVTVKLLPYKGRVYFSTFETGMDYEFLFVLANKHGGSDSVPNHALSFPLLIVRCWLNCVNIPGGLSRGGDIHTQPTYPTQGLSRSVSEPEPLI